MRRGRNTPDPVRAGQPRSTKVIVRAVEHVFRVASADEARSIEGLVQAVGRDRDRPISVTPKELPAGIFGQWIPGGEADEIVYADWVQYPERTIAHELGHIVLSHRGRDKREHALAQAPEYAHDLIDLMMRSCAENDAHPPEEVEAEQFASLLLQRISSGQWSRDPAARARLGEAFG